jgi:hypothetical protein
MYSTILVVPSTAVEPRTSRIGGGRYVELRFRLAWLSQDQYDYRHVTCSYIVCDKVVVLKGFYHTSFWPIHVLTTYTCRLNLALKLRSVAANFRNSGSGPVRVPDGDVRIGHFDLAP